MVLDVTKNRLQGQYLNRRTGTLIRSITASPFVQVLDTVIRGIWGSNLSYARVHEEGYRGRIRVPGHERGAHRRTGHSRRAHRRRPYTYTNRAGTSVTVRAHTVRGGVIRTHRVRAHAVRSLSRLVSFRARHFMRDTVRDQGPEAMRRIRRALIHLVRTGEVPSASQLGGG